MRTCRVGPIGIATVITLTFWAGSSAAQSAAPNPAGDDAARLPIVEVVGCLSSAPAGHWMVANASDPIKSEGRLMTPEAMKAAAARSLGTRRYRLIGLIEFAPERFQGHKVAVKGLLIEEAGESRVNLTWLDTLAPTCKA